jgi:hypothetical protein
MFVMRSGCTECAALFGGGGGRSEGLGHACLVVTQVIYAETARQLDVAMGADLLVDAGE